MLFGTILFVLSALSTLGIYLLAGGLSHWWIIPMVLGFHFVWIVLYLLTLFVISLFWSKKQPLQKPKAFCRFCIVYTMEYLMRVLRTKPVFKGREKLPAEPCVLVSNHRSAFDPLAGLSLLKERRLAYISKESNLKIPLVGTYMYHAGFLAIDRENGMRALRTLKHAAEIMKSSKTDMGIYPEGTRSKTGELLEFKSGAFLLAKRADAPVVIIATRGTEQVLKNFPWRSTKIELEVIEVLDREQVKALSLEEMSEYVKNRLEQAL